MYIIDGELLWSGLGTLVSWRAVYCQKFTLFAMMLTTFRLGLRLKVAKCYASVIFSRALSTVPQQQFLKQVSNDEVTSKWI